MLVSFGNSWTTLTQLEQGIGVMSQGCPFWPFRPVSACLVGRKLKQFFQRSEKGSFPVEGGPRVFNDNNHAHLDAKERHGSDKLVQQVCLRHS